MASVPSNKILRVGVIQGGKIIEERHLKNRIDACLEGKGGETARRGRAAELGEVYLSLSPAGRRKFLLTLAHDYGLSREAAMAEVERWRMAKEPPRALAAVDGPGHRPPLDHLRSIPLRPLHPHAIGAGGSVARVGLG